MAVRGLSRLPGPVPRMTRDNLRPKTHRMKRSRKKPKTKIVSADSSANLFSEIGFHQPGQSRWSNKAVMAPSRDAFTARYSRAEAKAETPASSIWEHGMVI